MAKKRKKQTKSIYSGVKSIVFLISGVIGALSYQHFNSVEHRLETEQISKSTSAGSCKSHFLNEQEPVIGLPKMASESQLLCYESYAGRTSYISKSNLYSAEYLTATKVKQAKGLDRINSFHEESQLPKGKRAELSDYHRSGFDRGHLAPSADMPTAKAQDESFSLSNMVPQNSEHNRKTWSKVEQTTRKLAQKYNSVYVVTLPVYQDKNGNLPAKVKAIGDNQVYIPNYMAKAVYIPKLNSSAVYLSPNNESGYVKVISLNEFKTLSQIDVFPALADDVKSNVVGEWLW